MSPLAAVPTFDLSDYTSCDTSLRSRAIAKLGGALVDIGFVIVEGHQIDPRLIGDAYALWQRFFALDERVKRRYSGIDGTRGYTPMGVEHAKNSPSPDLKEFWHVGQELPPDHPLRLEYPPNVWPQELPELRQPTLALYHELERVAELLLMAFAEYFALPEETFAAMMRGGSSVLRILHYPPVPAAPDRSAPATPLPATAVETSAAHAAPALRAAPHEDINLITLLCEATDSGLQLLRRDGTWLPVESRPGQIVVDTGDMLSRITNEVVPATTHRVVNPPASANRDRYSMPFFVHPTAACDLSVLDRFVSADRPRRFPPITAGEMLDRRLTEIGLKR
jgi:isopenicillin N synthase-like dioxygenase